MLSPFRSKNRIVYPGDRLPGLDPTHAASQGVVFSGIAAGANFINLLNGAPGTITGSTSTGTLDGVIGPRYQSNSVAGSTGSTKFTISTPGGTGRTYAVIFRSAATLSGTNGLFVEAAGANAQAVRHNGTGISFSVGGVGSGSTGITLAASTPYFLAASLPTGAAWRWALVNLVTGQMTSGTATNAAVTQPTTGFIIGNLFAGNVSGTDYFAAAMYSTAVLSAAQLAQWAADPWSFWYPPAVESLIGAGLATPTTIVPPAFPVTYQRNQRIIMTG
jgi:hypothetical protein